MKKTLFYTILLFLIPCSIHSQVGFTLGNEYGFGALAQIGIPEVKLEVGVGIAPIITFFNIQRQSRYLTTSETKTYLYFPTVYGAKFVLGLSNVGKNNQLNLKFGGSFNSLLKTGIGGGINYTLSKKSTTVEISGGIMYYSSGYDEIFNKILEEEKVPLVKDDTFSFLTKVQPFLSVIFIF